MKKDPALAYLKNMKSKAENTRKKLVQLVDQMKKDQAKLGKRALRSKAKTFNEIIKTSIWSMFSKDEYTSNEMSEQDKMKAVEDLADKIMKTHYYYNGDVEQKPVNNMKVKHDAGFVTATSDNNDVKDHQNKSVDSPLCHKKRALFASIKKRKGLNDITNSNEKSKKSYDGVDENRSNIMSVVGRYYPTLGRSTPF